jgi:CheY-like chemotaxis protein
MVYGFVKQSRGHVKVYSEPGHGTTVKVYLPRAGGLDEAEVVDAAPSLASLHGSETILLVEDDALVRQYAEQQLCGLGYRVVSASDGVAAMGVLTARNDIDLLFTDVVMPGGLNGRQLADAAWAVKPGLKVLFSSGYTENAIVHHGRLDRGAHLLSKPYGRLELARKVRETLAAPAAPLGEAGRRQGPGRLLVLDDDPFVGEVLGMAAQKLGFQSALTSKPRDFFSRVVQWQPSHVAIDLSMPDMSGLQVLSRLAEIGCDARVIVTSGADPGQMQAALDRAHALGLNVVGLLPKPFSAPALRALLVGEGDR